MKYIFSNGLKLEVRDIGEVIYQLELTDRNFPLPIILKKIVTSEEARKLITEVKNSSNYKRVK